MTATATFRYQQRIRGELSRHFDFEIEGRRFDVTGAHMSGPWWDVYVMTYTPRGYLCGLSHKHIDRVPGGLGRDERICTLALNFLVSHHDYHETRDPECRLCRPVLAR